MSDGYGGVMRTRHGPDADEFRRRQEGQSRRREAYRPMGPRKQRLHDEHSDLYVEGCRLGVFPVPWTGKYPEELSPEQRAAVTAYEAKLEEFKACPWEE